MKLSEQDFRKLKNRNPQVFAMLYDSYKQEVFNYLMIKSKHNLQVAEEVFSATICSALESVVKLKNHKNLLQWLLRIANNKYNDYLRNIYRDKKIIDNAGSILITKSQLPGDLNGDIEKKDRLKLLRIALKSIKPAYRQIIIMKIFKNYTHQEIAQRINKSRDAAESLFQRAIVAVKKELKQFSNYF